VFIEK